MKIVRFSYSEKDRHYHTTELLCEISECDHQEYR